MAREKEAYRDNLERLTEIFGEKELLCRSEVQRGLHMSRRAVENLLAGHLVQDKWISKSALARLIS